MSAAEQYAHLLDKMYKEAIESDCEAPVSKFAFIGDHIFDFTTYDSDLDEGFAKLMLDVLNAIHTKNTFEYQKLSQAHYENYILMCNMPFLNDKLSWGTSIRGAWFEDSEYSVGAYEIDFEQIPKKDFPVFIEALIKWAYE